MKSSLSKHYRYYKILYPIKYFCHTECNYLFYISIIFNTTSTILITRINSNYKRSIHLPTRKEFKEFLYNLSIYSIKFIHNHYYIFCRSWWSNSLQLFDIYIITAIVNNWNFSKSVKDIFGFSFFGSSRPSMCIYLMSKGCSICLYIILIKNIKILNQ